MASLPQGARKDDDADRKGGDGAAAPAISVIIPVYNARSWLDECLTSVLAQGEVSFEVILVDDGSTDGSGELCDRWRAADRRFRVIHTANAGVAAARNHGLEAARGEFVVFVDADDLVEPGAFAALLAAQREHDADFVRGAWRMVITMARHPVPTRLLPATRSLAYIEDVDGEPRVFFTGMVCAALIRRQFIEAHRLRFEDMLSGEDVTFILAIAALPCRFHYLDRSIFVYRRQEENSLTLTFSASMPRRLRDQRRGLVALDNFLARRYDPERVATAVGGSVMDNLLRSLVACAAASLTGGGEDAWREFAATCADPAWRRYLPYYRREGHPERSWLLPVLVRLGWRRLAFRLCRRKARKRYGPQFAAAAAAGRGEG
ncbi:MAG: glycosyltransferase [Planctomycetes bacterium]|nr:glycosyltransferase [Planctomycetota bacterium]